MEIYKKEERTEQKNFCKEKNTNSNILAKIKSIQPANQEALALQEAAAKVGFDWQKSDKIFAKIAEELEELKEAIKNKKFKNRSRGWRSLFLFSLILRAT